MTKINDSCKYECLGEVVVVTDPFLLKCIGFDDCSVYLLAFKLSTLFQLSLSTIFISFYLKSSKVEAG